MSRSTKRRSSSSNTTTRARNPRRHIMKENTEDTIGASASSAAIVDAKNKSNTTKKRRSNNILKEQDTNASSSLPKRRRLSKKNENSSQVMPPMPPLPVPDFDLPDVEEENFESTSGSGCDMDNGGDNGQNNKKKNPKRPLNAYFLFANDIRDQVKAAHPDLPSSQIMSKIAEAYNTLNPDAKKWYEAAAKTSFANYAEQFGQKKASANEKYGFDGRPANPAEGLPPGWTTRAFRRPGQSNKHNKSDRFWYSPIQLYRFRSMVKVEQFLERLDEVNGDEVMAYKLCNDRTKNCTTTNSTDISDIVVYDRKIAKKRAKSATKLKSPTIKKKNSTTTKKKKPLKPKRPCNVFSLYAKEVQDQVRAAHPDLKGSEVMCKIAYKYNALDNNTKRRYKTRSDRAIANFKAEVGEDAMHTGAHSTFVEGLPSGWTKRIVPRKVQSRTKSDTYWYSPIQSYKFPSMTKVKRFLENLEETGGDEVKAFRVCSCQRNKKKSADAVDDSKTVKKRKSRNIRMEEVVVVKCADEDDEMPESWDLSSEEDVNKNEEDGMHNTTEEVVEKCTDEDVNESEDDEMPESWDLSSEEDEMPESWAV